MAKKPVHLIKAPREPVPLAEVALRLHPADDVAIAKLPLAHGTLILGDEGEVQVRQLVPAGHKLALRAVRKVRRFDVETYGRRPPTEYAAGDGIQVAPGRRLASGC